MIWKNYKIINYSGYRMAITVAIIYRLIC